MPSNAKKCKNALIGHLVLAPVVLHGIKENDALTNTTDLYVEPLHIFFLYSSIFKYVGSFSLKGKNPR